MTDVALNATMYSLYESKYKDAWRRNELKRALKHLERSGISHLSASLSDEQIELIKAAQKSGAKVSITLNIN